MNDTQQTFAPVALKMQEAGIAPEAISRFEADFLRLVGGDGGWIPEDDIQAVGDLDQLSDLQPVQSGNQLQQLAVIKLNGGLGTSMGLDGPKGAIPVKQGLSFLAITAQQIGHIRKTQQARLPLILMNSFATREVSLKILAGYGLHNDVALDFLQTRVPKIETSGFAPASYPPDPDLEWCPPGHGEIYSALRLSGLLDELLERGYQYAFVSNVDNLGASVEPRILQWFADSQLDFAMEVTRRTDQDRKGGHLARRRADGRLLLREVAQCPPEQSAFFEDIERYRFFNTNNLWLNLASLKKLDKNPLLPLIMNRKTVNPADRNSTPVVQLESAMGAAIGWFEKSAALEVDRTRFLPVKSTTDLLRLSSDLYTLNEDSQLAFNGQGSGPKITLDERFYRNCQDWQKRFPRAPGLLKCNSLKIEGDVTFETPVFQGHVAIVAQQPATLHGSGPFEGTVSL